ncbi:hypothetical protein JHL21_03355 [Devosia sp. WQ 349]|uniref:hypothetical protein n=1 Tax=Devosia sp. WQ 349K1 TaxID=2800329 RepID=UPI0019031310|nr:hypothetical protein [Devosia sp. WQ 349K1]MBK1793528.1 hypothetical protein [Devosia sp. WQ 349K1]
MTDYLKTQSGKLAVASYRYFEAAKTIFLHTDNGRIALAPTLHLAAHGLEVLLKSALTYQGYSAAEVQADFGHDIRKMWDHPKCSKIREVALDNCANAELEALATKRLAGPPNKRPRELLAKAIVDLSIAHSKQPLPLRYASDDRKVPPPHIFIYTFLPLSEEAIHNPRNLFG